MKKSTMMLLTLMYLLLLVKKSGIYVVVTRVRTGSILTICRAILQHVLIRLESGQDMDILTMVLVDVHR